MGYLVAPHHQIQQVQPPLVLENAPDGGTRLGGDDGGAHPRVFQRPQQLLRAGEEGGPFDHQPPPLAVRLHAHGVLEAAVERLLPLRVMVPGEQGVAVGQGEAHSVAHLLHGGGVQAQLQEAQTVALGDGGGGIAQCVIKVKKYPAITHDVPQLIEFFPFWSTASIISQAGPVFNCENI